MYGQSKEGNSRRALKSGSWHGFIFSIHYLDINLFLSFCLLDSWPKRYQKSNVDQKPTDPPPPFILFCSWFTVLRVLRFANHFRKIKLILASNHIKKKYQSRILLPNLNTPEENRIPNLGSNHQSSEIWRRILSPIHSSKELAKLTNSYTVF